MRTSTFLLSPPFAITWKTVQNDVAAFVAFGLEMKPKSDGILTGGNKSKDVERVLNNNLTKLPQDAMNN